MKCPSCGAEIETGRTCSFCGAQISSEMLRENEILNKEGCPKCGSTNVTFNRENQGEVRGKNSKQIVHHTVGVCKDCGYTWRTDAGQTIKKRKTWLWVLGWIFIFPLPLTLILLKKKDMKPVLKYGIIAAAWLLFLVIGIGNANNKTQTDNTDTSKIAIDESLETQGTSSKENNEASTTEATENTYENNEYYDIVETGQYTNSIGTTYLIHKVLAKQDVSISATVIATDSEGNVIGKSSDDIILTKGQSNYFRYMFEADITNASFEFQAPSENNSIFTGTRNGVELVTYNQSGDDLYITVKQTVDKLGSFAQFKLIFYKNDIIVNTEDGYFSAYTENLSCKDSTDVAKIWVYGVDFDRIEYIYEP